MKKYHIITFGCQMNEHDSENIAGMLEGMGYEFVADPYEADVVVMNTCSVREHADKRFYGMLGQFKKRRDKNKDSRIVCVWIAMLVQAGERRRIRHRLVEGI